MPNAAVLTPAVETPFAVAAISLSRTLAKRPAEAAAHDEERKREHHERHDPADDVEPDRRVVCQPSSAWSCGRFLPTLPPVKCGNRLRIPMNESGIANVASARYGPANRRRGEAEREPDHAGDDAGERDRPEVAPAVVDDEDRRRVRADPHEGAVAERDLPGEAGEDVEAERARRGTGRRTRAGRCGSSRRGTVRATTAHDEHGERDRIAEPPLHTRLTTTRPKSPAGLISRTTSRTPSATGSRSSDVTGCT